MDTLRSLQRLLTPVMARIRRVVMGSVIKMVDDSGDLQKMQVQSIGRSVYDNIESFGVFGMASNPPIGLDAIIVERNGKYISIAIGDREYRIKDLESGDTAIYDIRGQIIKLNKDGIKIRDSFGNNIQTTESGIDTTDVNGNNIKLDSTGISMTDSNGNSITMTAAGININGVLITSAGAVTAPSTIVATGNITAADLITATGGMLSAHYHLGGTITDPITGQMVTGAPVPVPA